MERKYKSRKAAFSWLWDGPVIDDEKVDAEPKDANAAVGETVDSGRKLSYVPCFLSHQTRR